MPAKIIVKDFNGEQTFDLLAPGKLLGREPGCDLQFLDGKLSRRHARFEVSPQGVRLIDLNTTNGCFVNGQRITEAWLNHGDKIRVGNLDITFLSDTPHDMPTAVLPAPGSFVSGHPPIAPHPRDQETRVQASPAVPEENEPTTRILSSMPEEPRTMVFDPHRMQRASQQPPVPAVPHDIERSTQIISAPASTAEGGRTVALGGPIPGLAPATAAAAESPDSLAPMVRGLQQKVISNVRFPTMAWRTKFILMSALMIVFLAAVITVPLLMIQEKATVRISLDRGLALANLLAARNRFAVVNNQPLQLDADFIAHESGVVQAALLDSQGRILSPSARAGQIVTSFEGIDQKPEQIRTLNDGVAPDGNYNFVVPIKNDNAQTVGLAWMTFAPIGLSESAASLTAVIMLVIFLSALVGAVMVWVATNMTVRPLAMLRDATESVIKGDAFSVEELAGFAEANDLARSINRLIDRGVTAPVETPLAPSPAYGAPVQQSVSPGSHTGTQVPGNSGELIVDGNFTVVRVSGYAESWLGARAGDLVGKHVIEAVHEQALLEVILDLVNTLATQPHASQECDFSSIASLGGTFALTASKSPAGDQTVICLAKKQN